MPADKKVLWAVVLFCANLFAMPFFWFYYVWKPLDSKIDQERHNTSLKTNYRMTVVVFAFLMLSLIAFTMILVAYYEGNSYRYLSDEFPAHGELDKNHFRISSMYIRKQLRVYGAVGLKDIMNLHISDNAVTLQPKDPYSIFYRAFELQAKDIHSCSKQCGGATDYMVILDKSEFK